MAFLKFNKAELVNLSYSLKREIILANKIGAYCNTSIVTCNTRRYHGLLAVMLDRFGGDRFLLLSSLDESLVAGGVQFNLGIHCYGDVYEPRGHKYIIDFDADPAPSITYKVGQIVFRKTLVLAAESDQLMIKYELLEAPSSVTLSLKPFLAFRNIHALTHENPDADTSFLEVQNGVSFYMYRNFPTLNLQLSDGSSHFVSEPYWNKSVVYSDEARRGFDCREDLFTPGRFEVKMKPGSSVIFSASKREEDASALKTAFKREYASCKPISSNRDQLVRCADLLVSNHNGRKRINAGFSWMYTGLLRETLQALPGLTLCGLRDKEVFEEILDNLIADEKERLFRRTTQVEAPLYMASVLQIYIDAYKADPERIWKKYGPVIKKIIESYRPGVRQEVSMHPNGLLWAQKDGVALSWMNAYIDGRAVTERAGYQVETNAFWYNTIRFALEMEGAYGTRNGSFVKTWRPVAELVKSNFLPVFWYERGGYLADYVDNNGQNVQIRPNQIYALWVKYSPLDELLFPRVLKVIDSELVTARGLRTLSPRDELYRGVYEGTQFERDNAYHQGSTRPFLLEPYVAVCFRVKGPSFWKRAEWLAEGFYDDLLKHGVGAFSELYDGDPPHEPHGAISSSLSTAALLAVDSMLEQYKEEVK
ncbi:MAG: amylo-alpha-1,6-glucosidase [Bacteroidales bacterium]|nr:amylo-alpha-1,6-glucosidase [Bacteroidales bacterium]